MNTIVYGGQGAYARVEALRAARVPVLVNLNWPKEEKARDPEAETPFRTLAHRRLAPTTPADLAQAKVPFAFYSGGLATTSEIMESVRSATTNGLSNEAALAVMESLRQRGLWVPAIRPPTVPPGTARLRIALSAAHTESDVQELLLALAAHAADCIGARPEQAPGTSAPSAAIA